MPASIKDLKYDTFFEDSLSAFEAQLYDLFRTRYDRAKDKRVFRINSDAALNEMVKNSGKAKGKFPFLTTKLTSITPNVDGGYNTPELRRKGIQIRKPNKEGEDRHYLHMYPEAVLASMSVSFIAQDEKDAIFFAKRWLDSIKNGFFDFQLMIYDTPIKIKVRNSDASVSLPDPQEIVSDTGNLYLVETSGAEIHTYIMSTESHPAIKRYHLKIMDTDNAGVKVVDTPTDIFRDEDIIKKDV
jgi:hypothetical protein